MKNINLEQTQEIIITEAEINEIKQKINKTKSWFLEKVNKIDNLLAKLTKKKEKREIINIRKKSAIMIFSNSITTDPMDVKRIIKEYYELYAHTFNNLDKMDQLLERHNLPRFTNRRKQII